MIWEPLPCSDDAGAGTSLAPAEVVQYIARHSAREFPDGTWKHKFDRNVYATREIFDGVPYWSRIKVPTLLVKGDQSERITPEIVGKEHYEAARGVHLVHERDDLLRRP